MSCVVVVVVVVIVNVIVIVVVIVATDAAVVTVCILYCTLCRFRCYCPGCLFVADFIILLSLFL